MVGLLCAALVLGVTGGLWFFKFRNADEHRYVAQLSTVKLLADFGTTDAAITQGKTFCTKLAAGAPRSGYRSQQIAVANFCNQFSSGFAVLPTPKEQQEQLTTALRLQKLGGVFPSDAAAVAHAQSVCHALENGGPQQGPPEDAVAVSIYCSRFESGFTTLRPIKVDGTITLSDSSPSVYYPSIIGDSSSCEGGGSGGYSDITAGREVIVKDGSGTVLTTTELGTGTGSPPVQCEFNFSFTVMDGVKGGYSVTVSHRGDLHFTAAELKIPGRVALTLGS